MQPKVALAQASCSFTQLTDASDGDAIGVVNAVMGNQWAATDSIDIFPPTGDFQWRIHLFDPVTDTFVRASDLPIFFVSFPDVASDDGSVVFGGEPLVGGVRGG
ncbi:MAG: hypothetical protein KDD47_26235, partial [Acidobacteria bacterium]|nr:hypothetical protein [Acidobacteriota bacterium]